MIIYLSIGLETLNIIKLPEWMFISIIIYGDTIKKLILYQKKAKEPDDESKKIISVGVIGIVISCTFLVLSITLKHVEALKHVEEFKISGYYYVLQMAVFIISIVFSAVCHIYTEYGASKSDH